LRRFFVEEIQQQKGLLSIRGPEARHITRVLRMGRGDRLILIDRNGARFQALIESVRSHEVMVTLEKTLPAPSSSPAEIILCQALLRSGPMDYVIQKTSELGVSRIVPFSSERTVIRLSGEGLSSRWRHWQEVARSAAKQSNRRVPAEIGHPCSFTEMVEVWKTQEAIKIILWEEEDTGDLKTLLRELPPGRMLLCIVGPEGGFTRDEIARAGKAGFLPLSLGYRILRAETAAVTVVAILQYEWGDLSRGVQG
jgi:16S rRNA (uracil1498-N3)-methyltransferase